MSYPKWKFKGDQKQIVQTPDEEKQLGAGWGDAPSTKDDKNDKHEKDEKDEPVKKK